MNKYDFLPIGTIVEIEDFDKKIMIYGYRPISDGKEYDYCGLLFPFGYDQEHEFILLNKDIITKVVHPGYRNKMFEKFKEIFVETPKQENNGGIQKQSISTSLFDIK